MINDYIARYRPRAGGESRWFAIQKSLAGVIDNAGMARGPFGKRFSHQRRIPFAVLERWTAHLRTSARQLGAARTFARLHEMISAKAEDVYGIGSLTAYDTALRIGAFLGLEPDRVYLHAGTRDGARIFGLGDRPAITAADLPAPFQRLNPSEIEDCLCIYRDELEAIRRPMGRRQKSS